MGAVFLVGCAVGGASSQLVVPLASAQQAATLTRWEYNCIGDNDSDEVMVQATRLGAQAWELAAGRDYRLLAPEEVNGRQGNLAEPRKR